jgi:hypothetical protein
MYVDADISRLRIYASIDYVWYYVGQSWLHVYKLDMPFAETEHAASCKQGARWISAIWT